MKNFLIETAYAIYGILPGGFDGGTDGGSDGGTGNNTDTFTNPLGNNIDTIPDLINLILKIVMQVGIPIIALMIMCAGFLYVTARGNETQLTKARTALVYTLIGAAIILGAFVISNAITGTIINLSR